MDRRRLLMTLASAITIALATGCPSPPPGPPIGEALPGFELTERSEQPFSRDRLDGRVWVVDLIFTSCEASCPMQTERMKQIARGHADRDDLRFLSISVDPGTDTPERLREYAEKHGVGELPWSFVTGSQDEIVNLVTEGFRLPVMAGNGPLTHSSRFVLLDRRARTRGAYESMDEQAMAALERDLAAVLAEPATTS